MLTEIAERERTPIYVAGETTGDKQLVFEDSRTGIRPIDLNLDDFFGKPPRTKMVDSSLLTPYSSVVYDPLAFDLYLNEVLQLEAVACKDWLTNKVDRAVSGKIAKQ